MATDIVAVMATKPTRNVAKAQLRIGFPVTGPRDAEQHRVHDVSYSPSSPSIGSLSKGTSNGRS